MRHDIRAVLFDLDGTLIDSAPDLAAAINAVRQDRGLAAVPYHQLRPMVGSGARGMIGAAFGVAPGHEDFDVLKEAFLVHYGRGLLRQTRVFDAMSPVLQAIDSAGIAWGVVTNKVARFADPVVAGLGLHHRAATVVCGDTTPHAKPHPAPLFEAARRLSLDTSDCLYVGDDLRDVQAGRAAGMRTAVAAWGYLGMGEPIEAWNADFIFEQPADLLHWLELA